MAEAEIYCIVACNDLTIQKNILVIDWIDPTGVLRGQTVDDNIAPDSSGKIQKTYRLNLPKKGHVSRMLTGSRYGDEMYGTWTYRILLNGTDMGENHFVIH